MPLKKEQIAEIVLKFGENEKDTGSTEVQVALLTTRIRELTEHSKAHKEDHHGRYGLLKLVSQRRSLLSYLRNKSEDRYQKLIAELKLRK